MYSLAAIKKIRPSLHLWKFYHFFRFQIDKNVFYCLNAIKLETFLLQLVLYQLWKSCYYIFLVFCYKHFSLEYIFLANFDKSNLNYLFIYLWRTCKFFLKKTFSQLLFKMLARLKGPGIKTIMSKMRLMQIDFYRIP